MRLGARGYILGKLGLYLSNGGLISCTVGVCERRNGRVCDQHHLGANLFAFPENFGCDNHTKFFGFLDGQRIWTSAQYLEACYLPFLDRIFHGQHVFVDGINFRPEGVDSLDCNRDDQVEFVLCRDGEEVDPVLNRGFLAI